MTSLPEPDRNETTKPPTPPRIPDGDTIDARNSGLAGYRLLLDEFLSAIDGVGADEALSIAARVEEQDEYQDVIRRLLTNVVTQDGQRRSRAQARALAIRILGHLRISEALRPLTDLLDAVHEPPSQRAAAADAIGMIGEKGSLGALRDHMADPEPTVRRSVALALAEISVSDSEEWLQGLYESEDDPLVRKSVESTLGLEEGEKPDAEADGPKTGETSSLETAPWEPPLG